MRIRAASLVIAIALAGAVAVAQDLGDPPDASDQARTLENEIRGDPAMMQSVEELRDDPVVQEILSDPKVAEALRSGNIGALLGDPKIGELMDRPAVRDITRDLERGHPDLAR